MGNIVTGEQIDNKYRIDGSIGAGGMGTVYKATHTVLGRSVAIKMLHPEHAGDERTIQRFLQEAQIAGSLGHDNICEVTDIGHMPDGSPYLVMPLLKGDALVDILRDSPHLPLLKAVDIIDQTLSALDASHQAGIIHRDLKPDNIFITKVGDRNDFVKLLDFGISKMTNRDSRPELTHTGMVVGTPYYMSPEQAKGSKTVDHRTDLYSVGVILYRILTGELPFKGDTYNEIIANIFTAPFVPPSAITPDIPTAMDRLIIKAMERNPKDRFESASAMREALAKAARADIAQQATIDPNALDNTALERRAAPPSTEASHTGSWDFSNTSSTSERPISNRKRTAAILFAVCAVVILAVIWFTGTREKSTPEQRLNAVSQEKPTPPDVAKLPVAVQDELASAAKGKPSEAPEEETLPMLSLPLQSSPPTAAAETPKPTKTHSGPKKKAQDNKGERKKRILRGRSRTHVITDYQ